jgi:hypothetical protein
MGAVFSVAGSAGGSGAGGAASAVSSQRRIELDFSTDKPDFKAKFKVSDGSQSFSGEQGFTLINEMDFAQSFGPVQFVDMLMSFDYPTAEQQTDLLKRHPEFELSKRPPTKDSVIEWLAKSDRMNGLRGLDACAKLLRLGKEQVKAAENLKCTITEIREQLGAAVGPLYQSEGLYQRKLYEDAHPDEPADENRVFGPFPRSSAGPNDLHGDWVAPTSEFFRAAIDPLQKVSSLILPKLEEHAVSTEKAATEVVVQAVGQLSAMLSSLGPTALAEFLKEYTMSRKDQSIPMFEQPSDPAEVPVMLGHWLYATLAKAIEYSLPLWDDCSKHDGTDPSVALTSKVPLIAEAGCFMHLERLKRQVALWSLMGVRSSAHKAIAGRFKAMIAANLDQHYETKVAKGPNFSCFNTVSSRVGLAMLGQVGAKPPQSARAGGAAGGDDRDQDPPASKARIIPCVKCGEPFMPPRGKRDLTECKGCFFKRVAADVKRS